MKNTGLILRIFSILLTDNVVFFKTLTPLKYCTFLTPPNLKKEEAIFKKPSSLYRKESHPLPPSADSRRRHSASASDFLSGHSRHIVDTALSTSVRVGHVHCFLGLLYQSSSPGYTAAASLSGGIPWHDAATQAAFYISPGGWKKKILPRSRSTHAKKGALNRADNYKEQQPRESAGEAKRGWETTYLGRLIDTLKKMFSLEYTKQEKNIRGLKRQSFISILT